MKKKYFHSSLKTLLLLVAPFFSISSEAGKLVLVTDDPEYAEKVRALLEKTEPYASMQPFIVEIHRTDSDTLNAGCKINSQVERAMSCANVVNSIAANTNADKVLVIKNDPRYAAGAEIGGLGAAMTTSTHPRASLHELGHLAGFADECSYTNAAEANIYCNAEWSGPNVAFLRESPPYPNDESARSRHSPAIPWFRQILPSTKITTGTNLGTPQPNLIGLYRSPTCDKATNGISSWRPGDEKTPSIMGTLEGDIPPSHYPYIRAAFGITVTADPGAGEVGDGATVRN